MGKVRKRVCNCLGMGRGGSTEGSPGAPGERGGTGELPGLAVEKVSLCTCVSSASQLYSCSKRHGAPDTPACHKAAEQREGRHASP